MKRPLLPSQKRTLSAFGDNIRLARLRRNLTAEQIAERADISRNTLIKIERGNEGVSLGNYFRVLAILGLDKDLIKVAKDDELGRILQDAKLTVKERVSKR
ncbi:MAG: anaerobic benzoate catabolism transcriptional regulator [Bacteroidetes bacterium ADurb.Bin008]|nr:MAG: anaerobic benzoate catabolism transcriptional regulator [Bacteroidetes bacterium ADurb.Bin008]